MKDDSLMKADSLAKKAAPIKRIVSFMASMRFAIAILLALGLVSIAGTLLPQNEAADLYLSRYGDRMGQLIRTLGLDHVFTTVWYLSLLALLCLSLILCVILRLKPLLRAFSTKNRPLLLRLSASWLLHLGMLLIIVFFSLGHALAYQTTLYNIPGAVSELPGSSLRVAIDQFEVKLREDQSVSDYISTVRILEGEDVLASANIEVNHPLMVRGYQFSQASMGYAVQASVSREDKAIGQATLFQNEFVSADSEKFILEMLAFYPDYIQTAEGPASRSANMNNPHALLRVYYMNQLAGMNVVPMGSPVKVAEYTALLSEPSYYTLLAVRRDPYRFGAAAGALLFLIGLFMIFFGPESKKEGE